MEQNKPKIHSNFVFLISFLFPINSLLLMNYIIFYQIDILEINPVITSLSITAVLILIILLFVDMKAKRDTLWMISPFILGELIGLFCATNLTLGGYILVAIILAIPALLSLPLLGILYYKAASNDNSEISM